ncbi:MAG: universal stress protein [Pseudomonadales bacterium]|nr:universal stress protein [Pseudomonadales bacterium]
MYKTIVVPVDLAHQDKLSRALKIATDLVRLYDASLHLVSVTSPAPGEVAHNPKEYTAKLNRFGEQLTASYSIPCQCHVVISNDPASDLDDVLDRTFHDIGADLVVMASHLPGFRDYIFGSNSSYLATHSDLSIFVVR